jgi:hypothetical protein
LRFWNNDVLSNTEAVAQAIFDAVEQRICPPQSSPTRGEEACVCSRVLANLTEDLQDGAVFGGVTVRSPFTLDVREPAAAYAVTPVAKPRHRPRGRPKR